MEQSQEDADRMLAEAKASSSRGDDLLHEAEADLAKRWESIDPALRELVGWIREQLTQGVPVHAVSTMVRDRLGSSVPEDDLKKLDEVVLSEAKRLRRKRSAEELKG